MTTGYIPARRWWQHAILFAALFAVWTCWTTPSRAQVGFPGEEEKTQSTGAIDKSLEATIARGKTVYDNSCAFCHRADGMGVPAAFPPLVAGAKFEAEPAIVDPLEKLGLYEKGVMKLGKAGVQIDVVLKGIPGTRMFAFEEQISAQQVADVVTYIRNAWNNKSGELVTLEQVEAAKGKK